MPVALGPRGVLCGQVRQGALALEAVWPEGVGGFGGRPKSRDALAPQPQMMNTDHGGQYLARFYPQSVPLQYFYTCSVGRGLEVGDGLVAQTSEWVAMPSLLCRGRWQTGQMHLRRRGG